MARPRRTEKIIHLNPSQERFAQEIARGTKVEDAFVKAGYKRDRRNATRLAGNPAIRARVDKIKTQLENAETRALTKVAWKKLVGKEYVIDNLIEVAERCLQHKVITDAKGKPIRVEGPDGQMCLLVAFQPKEATRALELIGKDLGMFVDRSEHTLRLEERLQQMTPEERERDALDLAAKVKARLAQIAAEEATDAEYEDVDPTAQSGGIGE